MLIDIMLVNNLPTTINQIHNFFVLNNSFGITFKENNKIYYGLISSYRKKIIGGGWKKVHTWYGGYWIHTPYIYHPYILKDLSALLFDYNGNFYNYKVMNNVDIRKWKFIKTNFNLSSGLLTNKGITSSASLITTNGSIIANGLIAQKNNLGHNYSPIIRFLFTNF